jgi:altronate dehydratase small subunit
VAKIKAAVGGDNDNVGIALMNLDAGTVLNLKAGSRRLTVTLTDSIPYQHKFSLVPITLDQDILKYGEVIGKATTHIHPGQHVHVHNMIGLRLGAQHRKEGRK